jgi:Na+-translocating ferredoxin:NAD+ oxidoreductase RNF subunit RnfB
LDLLPGSNCGLCGEERGCAGFAAALEEGRAKPLTCPFLGEVFQRDMDQVFLDDFVAEEHQGIAILECQGGKAECQDRYRYDGVPDCRAAMLLGGGQRTCLFGCLQMATCVAACPEGAIRMNERRLPRIDEALCNGCGRCVTICPNDVLKMIPRPQKVYLACRSEEKESLVTAKCTRGCDTCRECAPLCPDKAIRYERNLPVIDFKACRSCGICAHLCPTQSFVDRVPVRPTAFIGTACTGCGDCLKVCPTHCIVGEPGKQHKINRAACIGCGLCFEICAPRAVTIFGALGHLEPAV